MGFTVLGASLYAYMHMKLGSQAEQGWAKAGAKDKKTVELVTTPKDEAVAHALLNGDGKAANESGA